jgi:hypothetical protein
MLTRVSTKKNAIVSLTVSPYEKREKEFLSFSL